MSGVYRANVLTVLVRTCAQVRFQRVTETPSDSSFTRVYVSTRHVSFRPVCAAGLVCLRRLADVALCRRCFGVHLGAVPTRVSSCDTGYFDSPMLQLSAVCFSERGDFSRCTGIGPPECRSCSRDPRWAFPVSSQVSLLFKCPSTPSLPSTPLCIRFLYPAETPGLPNPGTDPSVHRSTTVSWRWVLKTRRSCTPTGATQEVRGVEGG